jgi:hypothetical protein
MIARSNAETQILGWMQFSCWRPIHEGYKRNLPSEPLVTSLQVNRGIRRHIVHCARLLTPAPVVPEWGRLGAPSRGRIWKPAAVEGPMRWGEQSWRMGDGPS